MERKENRTWVVWLALPLVLAATLSPAEEKGKPLRIGLLQSSATPLSDDVARGFEKTLAEAGFKEGGRVVFDRQKGRGEDNRLQEMARRLIENNVRLLHTVADPASRAAVQLTRQVPLVFSSVSDPVASGLVPPAASPGMASGTNVTGVIDRWPGGVQFDLFARFFPKARKWGTLYDPGNRMSRISLREMKAAAGKVEVDLVAVPVANRSDVGEAARTLVGAVQVINLPCDPLVLSALDGIVKLCNEKKVPLFSGDLGTAPRGVMAACGWDPLLIGAEAGKKAVRILNGESPGQIPWGPPGKLTLIVNEEAARAQGAVLPPDLLKRADRVLKK
jgi:putative tryptophan/tyrosine transport system substrate-binding protein